MYMNFNLQIPLKRNVAIHLTVNLFNTSTAFTDISNDIKQLFRTVSLVKPDLGMIMRAKCAAMGFKAPAVLGARLKVLQELAKDQL